MVSSQGGYIDIELTGEMARLMADRRAFGTLLWTAGGVTIGLIVLGSAALFAFAGWEVTFPNFLTLSGDNLETWIVLGLAGLIAAALIVGGVTQARLGEQDAREGIAKRFHGPITIEKSRTTAEAGIERTTYSVLLLGVTLVRARPEVTEPIFARHVQTVGFNRLSSTATGRVSFIGWIEFAPHSQFIFRLSDDPESA
jgi:hypothetical protein